MAEIDPRLKSQIKGSRLSGNRFRTYEPKARFLSRCRETEYGCWEWTGSKSTAGYGYFYVSGGKRLVASRASYELFHGEIPAGLQIDHLCKNPGCVNPDHLEAVTQQENIRRGDSGIRAAERNLAKTYCPHGHAYDEANTYHHPRGHRACRMCMRLATRRLRARKREINGGNRS